VFGGGWCAFVVAGVGVAAGAVAVARGRVRVAWRRRCAWAAGAAVVNKRSTAQNCDVRRV